MSASSASRRAWSTWHCRKRGHCEPRQLSRVDVASGMAADRSSSPGNSARSPDRVVWAHCSPSKKRFYPPRCPLRPPARRPALSCEPLRAPCATGPAGVGNRFRCAKARPLAQTPAPHTGQVARRGFRGGNAANPRQCGPLRALRHGKNATQLWIIRALMICPIPGGLCLIHNQRHVQTDSP